MAVLITPYGFRSHAGHEPSMSVFDESIVMLPTVVASGCVSARTVIFPALVSAGNTPSILQSSAITVSTLAAPNDIQRRETVSGDAPAIGPMTLAASAVSTSALVMYGAPPMFA